MINHATDDINIIEGNVPVFVKRNIPRSLRVYLALLGRLGNRRELRYDIYDLSGRIAHKGTKGIVIEDGKKVLMR